MKQLKKDLKNSMDKDEAFIKFINRNGDQKKGSRILSLFPEPKYAEKYAKANKILITIYGLLSLFAILGLSVQFAHLPPLWLLFLLTIGVLLPALVLYLLYKKNAGAYMFLAFLLVKGIFDLLRQSDQSMILIGIVVNLGLLIFVVILKQKMFPYQNFFNTKKDTNGLYIYKEAVTA
ncbi:hypothetical protein [Sulfuricurvum sp.]|uniref:hypothetical protein n=1 Tax=Sulfuricurvum sp. TaxID=2025608 RepID=UPI002617085F|nr:hypothetical protein [Sulfuricurvum sp.]MDD2779954.1 hypothetical protein [Sulfuricurvum sp.]